MQDQCCALSDDNDGLGGGTRCILPVCQFSKHCEKHHNTAKKLYFKYKELCKTADELNILKPIKNRRKKIAHLRKCHDRLVAAYDARIAHRNYAFAPECHDFGHELQFKIIQEKIDKCKEELCKIATTATTASTGHPSRIGDVKFLEDGEEDGDIETTATNEPTENIDETAEHVEESKEEKTVVTSTTTKTTNTTTTSGDGLIPAIKSMRKFARKKIKDEQITERMIARYAQQNKILIEEKTKMVNSFVRVLNGLSGTDDPNVNRGVMSLILELWSEKYFNKNYEPEMCDRCNCGRYLTATFRLCPDMRSYRNTAELLERNETDMLKMMYQKIISNLKKISPVVKDVLALFKVYGKRALTMGIEMTWSPDLERLTVRHSSESFIPEKKKSQILAMQRARDKTSSEMRRLHEEHKLVCPAGDDECDDSDCDCDN